MEYVIYILPLIYISNQVHNFLKQGSWQPVTNRSVSNALLDHNTGNAPTLRLILGAEYY